MNDNDKQQGPDNGGGNPWMKSLLIWFGILLVGAVFVTLFNGAPQPAASSTIAYSAFLDKVEAGNVRDVNVAGEVITGTFKDSTRFRTYAMQDPQLTERLRKNSVIINAKPEDGTPIWQYLLVQSLPFVLMLGVALFFVRQMQKNSGSGGSNYAFVDGTVRYIKYSDILWPLNLWAVTDDGRSTYAVKP